MDGRERSSGRREGGARRRGNVSASAVSGDDPAGEIVGWLRARTWLILRIRRSIASAYSGKGSRTDCEDGERRHH